jgi:hypothetical protein
VRKKDAEGLFNIGEDIDQACEAATSNTGIPTTRPHGAVRGEQEAARGKEAEQEKKK